MACFRFFIDLFLINKKYIFLALLFKAFVHCVYFYFRLFIFFFEGRLVIELGPLFVNFVNLLIRDYPSFLALSEVGLS
jgi:hypothetical protein